MFPGAPMCLPLLETLSSRAKWLFFELPFLSNYLF